MNFFDALTWIGRWPFAFCPAHTPRTLAAHLRRHGIRRALVSPLDAVFAPAPGPANRELLRSTRGVAGLEPVPVINPALANWREELDLCASDPRVRAVRLLPNYHDYRLASPAVAALITGLNARGLRLIVQMQMIDARHEYHAMNLKPVAPADLAALLQRAPELPVLASGLQRPDLLRLTQAHPQLLADLSFAEWLDTVAHLLEKVPARQLVFASHTPLLITAAARAKFERTAAPRRPLEAIARDNLERFLLTTNGSE